MMSLHYGVMDYWISLTTDDNCGSSQGGCSWKWPDKSIAQWTNWKRR